MGEVKARETQMMMSKVRRPAGDTSLHTCSAPVPATAPAPDPDPDRHVPICPRANVPTCPFALVPMCPCAHVRIPSPS